MDDGFYGHVIKVPEQTVVFCGENVFEGARVLNVGCGEMLTDFGFLRFGPRTVTGLDIHEKPSDWLTVLHRKVVAEQVVVPDNYAEILSYTLYDGTHFPFADAAFDFTFSWSAFEHIEDIQAVLAEMYRTLRPGGKAFVQVFPWWGSRYGSHLDCWIEEPFFHLTRDDAWVKSQLLKVASQRPEGERHFISEYKFDEYRALNRRTPSELYEACREVGFVVLKARAFAYEEDLSTAPRGVPFHELMISGSDFLLGKAEL